MDLLHKMSPVENQRRPSLSDYNQSLFSAVIGDLNHMDFGKSVILTTIPLAGAFPIYKWVKSNDDIS